MNDSFKRQFQLPIMITIVFVVLSFIPIVQVMFLTFSGGLISLVDTALGKDNSRDILIPNVIVNLIPAILFLTLYYYSRTNAQRIVTAILAMTFFMTFIFFLTDGIYKDSDPYFINFILIALISGAMLALTTYLKFRKKKKDVRM